MLINREKLNQYIQLIERDIEYTVSDMVGTINSVPPESKYVEFLILRHKELRELTELSNYLKGLVR